MAINLPIMIDELARQEALVGGFLLAVGLTFMLMGVRLSRMVVALSYGVIGFVLGGSVPGPDEARIAAGMIVALGLGFAGLWLTRPAVAVLAGFWAAVAAFLLAGNLAADTQIALAAAAVIFVGAASLAFVVHKEVIALVTSLEGTLLFIGGLVIVLNQSPVLWCHMRSLFVSNTVFAPFLVMSGTVIGFYTQIAEHEKKQAGRSA